MFKTPYILLSLVVALILTGGGFYYQTKQNGKLQSTIVQQELVIQQQAVWAERLNNALTAREIELNELQDSLMQTVEDWSRYREHMEDSCVNSVHPDIYQWMHPQTYPHGYSPPPPGAPAANVRTP